MINDIKQDDFTLHHHYFNSLSTVKPAIHNAPASAKIPLLRRMIIQTATNIREGDYVLRVRNNLVKNNNTLYEEYLLLINDNQYALNDAARMERIESIYAAMTDQYLFIKDFVYETRVLEYSREHERNDIRFLRRTIAGDAATPP